MTKRLLIGLLVTVFVLASSQLAALASPGGNAFKHLESTLGYSDLDEAPWAAQYFMELSVKGLFQGRGNGKMAPQASVSRLEVLTLVLRALGMEEAADELTAEVNPKDFMFNDTSSFHKPQVAWGLGYLRLAIDQGLIAEGPYAFRPMAAAKRAWVAEILIKGLELGEVADEEMDTVLDATDADEVDPDQVGYLAVAMENGLLQGYPDGSLKPNKPVTRAEMAALLDRADEDGLLFGKAGVSGTVLSVTDTSITVLPEADEEEDEDDEGDEESEEVTDDGSVTYDFADGVLLFMKGSIVGEGGADVAGMLSEGDHVRLFLKDDLVAFIIASFEETEVKAQVLDMEEETEEVTEEVTDEETGEVTEEVTGEVTTQLTLTLSLADLEDEDEDEDEDVDEEEDVDTTAWYGDSCTEPDEDGIFTCTVDDSTYIKLRGDEGTLDDIGVGDLLELKFHGTALYELVVAEKYKAEFKAEILDMTDVTETGVTLSLAAIIDDGDEDEDEDDASGDFWYGDSCTEPDADGNFTCTIDETTYIKFHGDEGSVADMAVGDTLELKFTNDFLRMVVIDKCEDEEESEEEEAAEVEGTVVSFDTETGLLTVDVDGTSMVFVVGDDTELNVEPEELVEDAQVTVTYVHDENDEELLLAVEVEVEEE